jgi:hypothetical protein
MLHFTLYLKQVRARKDHVNNTSSKVCEADKHVDRCAMMKGEFYKHFNEYS